LLDSVPLTVHIQGQTRILRHGWNALTPILSARGVLGLFVNDSAISGAPVDQKRQAQVVLYCALLGNLWELDSLARAANVQERLKDCYSARSHEQGVDEKSSDASNGASAPSAGPRSGAR
jgi:hypothetical protein